jgi:hypothetical protein
MKVFNKFQFRMFQWFITAMVLFGVAAACALSGIIELRPVGAIASKAGNVTLAAFIGYWIDRQAFKDRLDAGVDPMRQLRRAIIIGFAMYAIAGG